jgi:sulfoxide reductase heme-binding subunit YedZ
MQRWRVLHRFTAIAWVLGVVHSLGEGTDAGQTWFLAMTAIVVLPALCLLAVRWLGSSREPRAEVAR